jgi:N-acetylmuramoyl-L-alanine amidase
MYRKSQKREGGIIMSKIRGTIDAGHGGKDRYNRGASGVYVEADGVLAKSKLLKEKLESTGAFEIQLTRDKDMTLALTTRAKMAVNNKSDFFISEHTNAGGKGSTGTEVFYSVDLLATSAFASELCKGISETLGILNRGARVRESATYKGEDYYTVIDVAQDGGIPNVFIVESAFHSNPDEEKLLLDPVKLEAIAEAEAVVICKHYHVPYPVKETKPSNKELLYRVRLSYDDAKSQTGAYRDFENARNNCNVSAGYEVYDWNGNVVFPVVKPDITSSGSGGNKKDDEVLNLQRNLNKLKIPDKNGNSLTEDGLMGTLTESALRRIQTILGLSSSEILNYAKGTINTVLNNINTPITIGLNSNNTLLVKYIQFRVGVVADGKFGDITTKAVISFQKRKGLTADGIVGKNTWKALLS